jgi:hypothetical protein
LNGFAVEQRDYQNGLDIVPHDSNARIFSCIANCASSPRSSPAHGYAPATAALPGAESFPATTRWAAVRAWIFPDLVNRFERTQRQPQFAEFLIAGPLRALAAAAQPGPKEWHMAVICGGYHPELPETSTAKLFLQVGAPHDGDTAHFHRAPDHSRWIGPLLRCGTALQTPKFPQIGFSVYAWHFF